MADSNGSSDEVVRRGQALYEQRIRPLVEPEHRGKFVIINVDTGEYEIDADEVKASIRARERFAPARLYAVRVGHRAVHRLGRGSSKRC